MWLPRARTAHAITNTHTTLDQLTTPPKKQTPPKNKKQLIGTLTNRACNGVHWSPTGRNVVLSGLKGQLNGQPLLLGPGVHLLNDPLFNFLGTSPATAPTTGRL